MSELNLVEIITANEARKKRYAAATGAPWNVVKPGHGIPSEYKCVRLGKDDRYCLSEILPADAKFIAGARNDTVTAEVDALIIEVARLRELLNREAG